MFIERRAGIAVVLVALVLSACSGGDRGGVIENPPYISSPIPPRTSPLGDEQQLDLRSGVLDAFGLRLNLGKAEEWRIVSTLAGQYIQVEYLSGECKPTECPLLFVLGAGSEMYARSVREGTLNEFDDCSNGASAFEPAHPDEHGATSPVGGLPALRYISESCPNFTQAPAAGRQKYHWLIAERGVWVQVTDGFDGAGIPDIEQIMTAGQWL